jgi:hypothetical protein
VIRFLNPEAWMLAVLAVLVAAFYFWRYPVRKERTATLWLWERALARRPAWYALRFWLSLAAQIALLLLMVAALTEPYWTEFARSRRTIVMLLDVSASMSATDGSTARFERMQKEARRIVAQLQRQEQMAIVSVGSIVRSVCRLTDNRKMLADSIDSVRPTDGTTRMAEAVQLARGILQGRQNPQMIILSDGGFPGADKLAAAEDIHMTVLRGQGENVAITSFASRPQVADPAYRDVLVEVANYGERTVPCDLEIRLQGETAESVALKLDAGQSQQAAISVPVREEGLLEARLQIDDALPADNQAVALVYPRQRPHVVFVSDLQIAVDRQLQTALEGDVPWDVTVVDALPAVMPSGSVVVLHREVPDELPPCPTLVINPQHACDLWTLAGVIGDESSAVGKIKPGSPLLDGVRLQDVVVEEAVRLSFLDCPATTLVESVSGEPLYSLLSRPGMDVLVLHVNLQKEKSDLIMRSDFPVLLSNAVQWLSRDLEPSEVAVTTGQAIEVPAPERPLHLKTENGREMELQPDQSIAALETTGVWTASADGQAASTDLVLPSNLLDRNESDLRLGADVPSRTFETAVEEARPLWVLLISIATVLLVLQWCLYHRRVVV